MINIAWWDLNKNKFLRLHDCCGNPKCKCQKQITFTPKDFQKEGAGIENTMKKIFKGTENFWKIFIGPGLKIATLIISPDVAAKTKDTQSAQITSNFLKSLTGGKLLSLTDLHGSGLRFEVM